MATESALRPNRWPGPPRRSTLLRAALVAVFLALAAGTLLVEPDGGSVSDPLAQSSPSEGCPLPSAGAPTDPAGTGRNSATGQSCATSRDATEGENGTASQNRPTGQDGATGRNDITGQDSTTGQDSSTREDGAAGAGVGGNGGAVAVPVGSVGLPVRLAEPAAAVVVRPGARVDLLVVPATDRPGEAVEPILLAERTLVLDVLPATGGDGAAVYLALRPEQANRAIGAPPDARFAIVVLP
nr:hypothetical protein [Micromonospora sp. DSM 115978]